MLPRLALHHEGQQLKGREKHPDAHGDRQEHLAVEAVDEDEEADLGMFFFFNFWKRAGGGRG